jgi:hypothetical protein
VRHHFRPRQYDADCGPGADRDFVVACYGRQGEVRRVEDSTGWQQHVACPCLLTGRTYVLAGMRLALARIGTQRENVPACGVRGHLAAFLAQDGAGAVRYQSPGGNEACPVR